MEHVVDRLLQEIKRKESCIVAGIDPHLDRLPPQFLRGISGPQDFAAIGRAIEEFSLKIIDAVAPYVVAIKPQVAFFEQAGWEGMRAFGRVLAHAKAAGLLTIADVKRGDIGSTAQGYVSAYFGGPFDADAVTINPYLGTDAVKPFLDAARRTGKAVFVLVKTSNPSSVDLQDLQVDGRETVSDRMAEFVRRWGEETVGAGGYSLVGAVVGATHPEQAQRLRQKMPHAMVLVPGYGAQGGRAVDVLPSFDPKGLGAIVSSSREILFAWEKSPLGADGFAQAAAEAARRTRDEIQQALQSRVA